MKTLTKYLAIIFLLRFCLFSALHAEDSLQTTKKNIFLQASPIKNKFTVKVSNSFNGGVYSRSSDYHDYKDPFLLSLSNFRVEANYGLLSCLEIGVYFGYFNKGYIHLFNNANVTTRHASAFNYGGQLNFHPLGLCLTPIRNQLDLWIGYKYGRSVESGYFKQTATENGLGIGACYFPFKKRSLGFHFEYTVGNWEHKKSGLRRGYGHDYRWGISYRFGK